MIRRVVDAILRRALPPGDVGISIRADLLQEWYERRQARPGHSHRLWLLLEAVKLSVHFGALPGGWLRGGGGLGADVRFGARILRRRPVFALVAVVTLGLGMGSATAMFSVVDGVLIRSVPFRSPGELVDVWLTADHARGAPGLVGRRWNRLPLSLDEYRSWQERNTAFEGIAVHNAIRTTLSAEDGAERVRIGYGSATLLSVLGVDPVLGRWFLPEEEGTSDDEGALVTVVSFETWKNRLGGVPDVLGRTLALNGRAYTVIGVLPPGFRLRYLGMHWLGEDREGIRDVWAPLGSALGNGNNLEGIARLAPGVSLDRALAEAKRILLANRGGEVRIVPRARDETTGLGSPLLLLLAATGLLLLVACANIATLSLGELHVRGAELATRRALGAGKGRIIRQLMVESLVLGALGTALGVGLAYGGTEILVRLAPPLPGLERVGMDLRVMAFAAAVGVLAVVAFGTLPALLSARHAGGHLTPSRTRTARRGGVERWLVSVEVALTVVLLISGGLLTRSLQRLLDVDPGFEPQGLATVGIYLPGYRYQGADQLKEAYGELAGRIAALPGVERVTAATRLPFPGLTNTNTLRIPVEGSDEALRVNAQQVKVLPGYHETMGIPLRTGRLLSGGEGDGPVEVVFTENIARRYWPTGSPVGITFQEWRSGAVVVGVAGDVRRNALGVPPDPAFYSSLLRRPDREISLVARTSGDARALAAAMADVVRAFDSGIPIRDVGTLPDLIRASASQERYRTLLMTVFAALATLLAGVGVFGTAARAVARRTREMGVRISLGAEAGQLVGGVVRDAVVPGLIGCGVGVALALAVGRVLEGLLFGVAAFDPLTYGVAAGFLLLVALAASYVPARRITALDPARVLRAE